MKVKRGWTKNHICQILIYINLVKIITMRVFYEVVLRNKQTNEYVKKYLSEVA